MTNRFEELLKGLSKSDRMKIINVSDTMYLCAEWCNGYNIKYDCGQLVAMAKLILGAEETLLSEIAGNIANFMEKMDDLEVFLGTLLGEEYGSSADNPRRFLRVADIGR